MAGMYPTDHLDPADGLEALRRRLEEAEQALEAIRTGQVESLVVQGPDGPRIFSLESADHSYRVLVESMNEGAATLAQDGTILYCNARFAAMLDTPIEHVMGSVISQFLPGNSRAAFEELILNADGEESRRELDLMDGQGHVVPSLLSASLLHDGSTYRVCLVAADLRAQRRSEELARSVLEQAAEAIVVCNDLGRVIRANGMATELCGCNPLSVGFDAAFPVTLDPPQSPGHGSVAHRALHGEVLRAAPAWLTRRDGRRVDLVVSAAPLTPGSGRITGCVITMSDVSERKRAEVALRELNEELADADRRKTEFIAVLSHELRNPLAPIVNCLSLLDTAPARSEEANHSLSVIKRQVGQLVRLVDDLLDVTRVSSNKVCLKLEPVDLVQLVGETLQDHRSTFEAKRVRLDADLPAGPVMVRADRVRMAQSIGNLLTNAAKFTPPSGTARVSLTSDGRSAVIKVTDSGMGMSPAIVARLFEPFAQADRTLDRSKGGLGLGLALVKGLVELHGGVVMGKSAGPGQGSEFTVRIPLDTSEARPSVPDPAPAEHRRRRILVIEDNVDSAESLRMVLESLDQEVEVAFAGAEGLEKARRSKPDLVLCDIGLPGMDGYEVARAVRADPELHGLLLVALTGYAMPEDQRKAADAGFDCHLAKPLRLGMLKAVLENLCAPCPAPC